MSRRPMQTGYSPPGLEAIAQEKKRAGMATFKQPRCHHCGRLVFGWTLYCPRCRKKRADRLLNEAHAYLWEQINAEDPTARILRDVLKAGEGNG